MELISCDSGCRAATSETARGINRGVVLNLIRRRQPISRADLARASGLQRSTVSLITEQLIQERWVVHGSRGRLPRGRRPTFLQLNDRRAILAVDLRPTLSTVAVADVNGRLRAQRSISTPADPDTAAKVVSDKLKQMMDEHSELVFEGVGISVPGRFDESRRRVVFAPNLSWPEFDLGQALEESTGLQVEVENAANACVLAEVWFGHTDKARDMVVVTVAEGVGTGLFANGQLVRGLQGMAGEFGHVPLESGGLPCACGGRGCWEVYASNRAALRYYHESGSASDGPSFQDLMALAEAGDALAVKALEKMAHALGCGMKMIVAGLAPEEIVVVGEFTKMWHRFGPVIEGEVASATLVGKPAQVRPAGAEPSMARLRGTVALVLQKHFGPSAAVAVGRIQESGRASGALTVADERREVAAPPAG